MRKGVVLSALLHAGVLVATVISWPSALDVAPTETPPNIPVELITVAEANNVMAAVTEPEPTPPEPPPEIIPEPAAPEAEAPPPEPEPEPEPEPPPPQVAPTPPPAPEPKVAETRAPERPALPRPRPPAEQPRQNFDLDSVIALLDKRAPAPPTNAMVAPQATAGIGARNAMTLDIEAALKAQMRECWNFPAGAPNPEQLIVQVRVLLARDGNLLQASLTPESMAGARANPYMRSAGEAAIRAVNICAPYRNLPADRYDSWREIVMTFDPKELAGR